MATVRSNRGFTLIEMAVVLVIVGLLVGFGASLVRPLLERSKRMETQEAVRAAVAALIGYAASNDGRLPDAALFAATIKRQVDSWQKPIAYAFDSNLDINAAAGAVCNRRTANITVRRCADGACTTFTDVPNVAFVIISGAVNRNNQTAGSQAVAAPATIAVYGTGVNADAYAGDMTRADEYDDIVEWVTLNELRSAIGCQGPQMAIVNNELPYGSAGSAYDIRIYADRGVPFAAGGAYKWCLKGALPPGVTTTPATPDCLLTTDCGALGSEAASQWSQADDLRISGTPSAAGTYFFSVLSRDNNDGNTGTALDNCARKNFVISINP